MPASPDCDALYPPSHEVMHAIDGWLHAGCDLGLVHDLGWLVQRVPDRVGSGVPDRVGSVARWGGFISGVLGEWPGEAHDVALLLGSLAARVGQVRVGQRGRGHDPVTS
jgi:hypothetical protein